MKEAKSVDSSLFFFFAVFAALFLQYPLMGRLPGNSDTILSIALTNLFDEKIWLFLTGQSGYTALFPAHDFLPYGENCFGLGLIFTFYKLLTRSDLWAYYLFMVTLFSLNAFAVSRLARLFTETTTVPIISGLVFSLTGFILGNIDDPNVIFVFFPVLALSFLEQGVRKENPAALKTGLFLSGLQIWFGMYIFLFQFIVLTLFSIFHFKRLKAILKISDFVPLGLLYAVPVLPLLALYLSNHLQPDLVSPYSNPLGRKLSSLNWYHFTNVLPNNLIYSAQNNIYRPEADTSLWYSVRKTGFPGLVLPLLTLIGLLTSYRARKSDRHRGSPLYLAILIVFFILSCGVNLFSLESIASIPLGDYFRVASRAYLFALLAVTIFFSVGLDRLLSWISRRGSRLAIGVAVMIAVVFVLENVPFPLPGYEYGSILEPPASYPSFFKQFPQRQIIVDLPSDYRALLPQSDSLWTYSRDAIYMNWQTYHKQIILGGINAYLPKSRIEVDGYIQKLPEKEAIDGLKDLGVAHLVFHKDFILFPNEDILEALKKSPELKLEFDDERISIFKI